MTMGGMVVVTIAQNIYIEHEKKRQKEQEAKDIEQLIKKSVKEVMEEK